MHTEVGSLMDTWARDGSEPGGACCVVRDGAVVADHVVGTCDGADPWETDTLVMTYSVAKPFAALSVLTVVADGDLGLDTRVAELWPAYAAHGKQDTTVRHVLSHAAGLPRFPDAAADVAFDDRERLVGLLADAAPLHRPGTAVAEHALTYGHLCDELVRRATGEDLASRFARIADTHGWDLHLRVPRADLGRVAEVVPQGDWPHVYLDDPQWGPALGRPAGLLDPDVINSERFRTTSFPAIGLHATARALAVFYADLVDADGAVATLLGHDLHTALTTAQATGHDLVLDRPVAWTLGLQVDEEEIGMGGVGGCGGWWSYGGRYAAAYLTRGLGGHARSNAVWELLERR